MEENHIKNKVFKKLAAAGVASMMAVTGMVMSVSADYSNVVKSGAYCSGRRVGNGALGSTSMVDGSYTNKECDVALNIYMPTCHNQ